jgi:predicted nucleic acid-binding Zn ribbon protein
MFVKVHCRVCGKPFDTDLAHRGGYGYDRSFCSEHCALLMNEKRQEIQIDNLEEYVRQQRVRKIARGEPVR